MLSVLPFYPFIYSIYLVLLLLAHNYGDVEPSSAIRPAITILIIVTFIFIIFWGLFRDLQKAGLATFLTTFMIFSYGHIYEGLKSLGLPIATIIRHRYLLPTLFILYLAALSLIWKKEFKPTLSKYLNTLTILLLFIPAIQIIGFSIETKALTSNELIDEAICDLSSQIPENPPDIYIIIMDAYERGDILEEMHGFDNSEFLDWLEAKGFFIAEGSLSNYMHTELSIPSLLNMNYIQSYPESYSEDSTNRMGVVGMISDNLLRQELECLGYQTVAFDTGLFWTKWQNADYYLSASSGPIEDIYLFGRLTDFEALLFDTTIGRAVSDGVINLTKKQAPVSVDQHDELRNRILFTFDQLEEVPVLPSPKLVFVHILSPHPPMVFGPNGEAVSYGEFTTNLSDKDKEQFFLNAYVDQVNFLNSKLQQVVSSILEQSQPPPIIIIQGDHGWADRNKEDKLSILNVYHLPNIDENLLYPTITPVNTFRLIMSHYFNADYPLLPDNSFYSDNDSVFQFEQIINTWPSEP